MLNPKETELLKQALETLAEGWADLPAVEDTTDWERVAAVLDAAARRMQDNYPYAHPLYAGQMLKPPHPVARLAYALSLWVNPNNHALDGGRASSAMEKSVIPRIAAMWGWDDCLGHLTGGGTMANLEALWVAGRLHPGKAVAASSQAHYTHGRITDVLGIPFTEIATTPSGHLDLDDLERQLERGDIGTVVVTMGSTGLGAVDPLPGVLALRDRYDFRIHADAAYGGYFSLSSRLGEEPRAAFDALGAVDSVVIDPHKHGLQPYGCGSVLFKDPGVGRFYKHGSPYTYFSSTELHLGEISLECSRPGAAAVALWATMELLPLEPGGEFAAMLDCSMDAGASFYRHLVDSRGYQPVHAPDLDIVVYAVSAATSSASSALARTVFEAAAEEDLHLALIDLPASMLEGTVRDMRFDSERVSCLRSTFMKPEHKDWVPRIVDILESLAATAREEDLSPDMATS